MADTLTRPAPAAPPAASRTRVRRRRKGLATYLLRFLVIAYLFFLIAWPLWQVVTHTFDDGLTSLRSLFEDPDMVSALRLSVFVAVVSVIVALTFLEPLTKAAAIGFGAG